MADLHIERLSPQEQLRGWSRRLIGEVENLALSEIDVRSLRTTVLAAALGIDMALDEMTAPVVVDPHEQPTIVVARQWAGGTRSMNEPVSPASTVGQLFDDDEVASVVVKLHDGRTATYLRVETPGAAIDREA